MEYEECIYSIAYQYLAENDSVARSMRSVYITYQHLAEKDSVARSMRSAYITVRMNLIIRNF